MVYSLYFEEKSHMIRKFLLIGLVLLTVLSACNASESDGDGNTTSNSAAFRIVSGSENENLEPIIMQFASQRGITIDMDYLGTLDMKIMLESGNVPYDAIWPANSLWLTLGDTNNLTKYTESIMRSPVVLALKKSIAERLGWVGVEVTVDDILTAAENEELRLMMTSATQSNSGASAYFGFLYAAAGSPDVLTSENLHSPQVGEKIKRILATIDRSSGSSGWLRDLFLIEYDNFDGMFNYEAVIIEANQELTRTGREPLYVIYPIDGLAIADSPFAYVDHSNSEKEQLFQDLKAYLLSAPVQQQILASGRRVGTVGLNIENADPTVFNPDWGINTTSVINPIRFPNAAVINEALNLYQTEFRKGSFTVYCLDFSGSMEGEGEQQLEAAMKVLLDQQLASEYLLQASPNDITIVLPFNNGVLANWRVEGNNPDELLNLYSQIVDYAPGGGTNIYDPVVRAFDWIKMADAANYFPAIILMSDGRSGEGSFAEVQAKFQTLGMDIPVFAITFGDASTEQMVEIADLTSGRVYDGTQDLIKAFRNAKGNN